MRPRAGTKALVAVVGCTAIGVCSTWGTESAAQGAAEGRTHAAIDASPIYRITVPAGYRDWRLISVKQLTGAGGKFKQLRAQLGNDIAVAAFRDGKIPFPDGAIIAALHWNEASSDADNKVLADGFPGVGLESSFAGSAVNVQFMVKCCRNPAAAPAFSAGHTSAKPTRE